MAKRGTKIKIIMLMLLSLFMLLPTGIVLAEADKTESLRAELEDMFFVSELGIERFMRKYKDDVSESEGIYTALSNDYKVIAACKTVNPLSSVYKAAKVCSDNNGSDEDLQRYLDEVGNAYDAFIIESEMEYEKNDARRLNEIMKKATYLLVNSSGQEHGFVELKNIRIDTMLNRQDPEYSLGSLSMALMDAINRFDNPNNTIPDKAELAAAIFAAENSIADNRFVLTTDETGEYREQEAAALFSALEHAKLVYMDADVNIHDVGEAITELNEALEAFEAITDGLGDEYRQAESDLRGLVITANEQLRAALEDGCIEEKGDAYNSKYANNISDMIIAYTTLLESDAKTAELTEAYFTLNEGITSLSENIASRADLLDMIADAKACQSGIIEGYYNEDSWIALNAKITECEQLLIDYVNEPTTAIIQGTTNALGVYMVEFQSSISIPANGDAIAALGDEIENAYTALESSVNQGKLKPKTGSGYENYKAHALYTWLEDAKSKLQGTLTGVYVNNARGELAILLNAFQDDMLLMASFDDKATLLALIEEARQLLDDNASHKGSAQGIDLQNKINEYTPLGVMSLLELTAAEGQITAKMNAFYESVTAKPADEAAIASLKSLIREAEECREKAKDYDAIKAFNLDQVLIAANAISQKQQPSEDEVNIIFIELGNALKEFNDSVKDADEAKLDEAREKLDRLLKSARNKLNDAYIADKISMDGNGDFAEPDAKKLDRAILIIKAGLTNIQTLEELNEAYTELEGVLRDFENFLDKVDANSIGEQRKALEDIIKDAKEKGIISVDASGAYSQPDAKELRLLLDEEAEAMLAGENPDQSKLKQLYSDILDAKEKLKQYVNAITTNRETLAKEIESAEKLLNEALDSGKIHQSSEGYSDEAANKLLKSVREGKDLIKQGDANLSDFASVMQRIKTGAEEFIKAHSAQNGLNTSKLGAELVNAITAIEAAEKGWTKYPDEALNTMKVELQAAQRTMAEAEKQAEIDAALERLKSALDVFLNQQIRDGQTNNNGNADSLENHLVNGWQNMDGKLYYYENGYSTSKTGWIEVSNIWYYLNKDASAATGWLKLGSRWYYLQPGSGRMQTGWLKENGKWYYLSGNGDMKTGWLKDGGKWYYLKASGAMATGWEKVDGKWYFMEQSGSMKTGWLKDSGKWYYLRASGDMAKGWIKPDTNWYYLYENGAMAESTWIGKYRVDSDGAWLR